MHIDDGVLPPKDISNGGLKFSDIQDERILHYFNCYYDANFTYVHINNC